MPKKEKMKYLLVILSLITTISSKKMNTEKKIEISYTQNDLQFTFLIFDNQKINDFFETYKPLEYDNDKIKSEYDRLSKIEVGLDNTELYSYKNNTEAINVEDYQIALETINSGLNSGEEEDRLLSLEYLFFNKTLPSKFQNKWVQTISGNFGFKLKFISLLREKNKIFDNLIYNGSDSNDERLNIFFNEFVMSEISPEIASDIKETITNEVLFKDIRFKTDKEIFIEFLDMTINKEWKLILLDWN